MVFIPGHCRRSRATAEQVIKIGATRLCFALVISGMDGMIFYKVPAFRIDAL